MREPTRTGSEPANTESAQARRIKDMERRLPPYFGPPIPKVLNPLNLKHYWLLFIWVYFQPSRLKRYLWQADPESYFQEGWQALRQSAVQPAIRNLVVMSILMVVASATTISVLASFV